MPMFIDNITWTNDSFRQQAESVCGNNTNCLFDAAVTIDTSFGVATKKLEEDNHQINNKLGKISNDVYIVKANQRCNFDVITTLTGGKGGGVGKGCLLFVKGSGILVGSFSVVNQRFWSHLGFSGRNATTFSCRQSII